MLTLNLIYRGLGHAGVLPSEMAPERILTEAHVDSRAVASDGLFVALRGARTDGHLYLEGAFQRGAIAAIAEERALELALKAWFVLPDGTVRTPLDTVAGPAEWVLPVVFVVPDSLHGLQELSAWWRSQLPVVAVGVTGSVGKTTTKETVANVLATRFNTLRTRGNLNSESGLPLELLRLRPVHERVVVEMGMYGLGEIARLCELARPRLGVVTNVGPVHLERLGTIENIARAKSELIRALPPADEGGVAVLNADDPRVIAMRGLTKARVLTYGLNPSAELFADEIESEGLEGIHFRCHYAGKALHIRLPMLGRHSVHTALRGAAVGLAEGLSWTEILHGLQDVRGQLRLMVVPGLRGTTLIDDTYNASPDSMLAALNLLEEIANASHRPVAVLGDMYELGSYEEAGHRLVGARAAEVAQVLVAVGARAQWFAEEAVAAGMPSDKVFRVATNAEAVEILADLMQPGDVVLMKGSRSAAMETIVDALSEANGGGQRS